MSTKWVLGGKVQDAQALFQSAINDDDFLRKNHFSYFKLLSGKGGGILRKSV